MFPVLAELNMTGKAIVPVAGVTIVEAKAEPGKLVFVNNIKTQVAFSRFINSEGVSIAAEVSFDFDIAGETHSVTFEELKQIETYYTALVKNLGKSVLEGTTKTAYVYSIAD
jgi:archaellum component FlaG (FlaF/FlaG flagellin family)